MAYPRYQAARSHKFFRRTAGDLTLNSNGVWADLPTIGTTWDVTLAAQVGDVIEAYLSGVADSAVTNSFFDVHTIVATVATTAFGSGVAVSNTNKGNMGWYTAVSAVAVLTGVCRYTLQAGDISAGLVTVRLRYQNSSATTKNLHATADYPLQFGAKNLGPADPN